ncbi:chemotaxis protein CheW [Lyngbya aestuarii]|uniref:chemotaxis protein CheW n=1 Tax=Lyngbya aestuarii TaxID=118322 RepID=UPI00403DD53B
MYEESETEKFIVFQIADYLLALPIGEVLKVVNYSSTAADKGLKTMGLIQLGKYTIRMLNLSERLSSDSSLPLPVAQAFLVITRSPQGELWGIAVEEPPNLMELPLERIHLIPSSESQSGVFGLASYGAVVSQGQATATIFLLDLQRVFNNSLQLSLTSS